MSTHACVCFLGGEILEITKKKSIQCKDRQQRELLKICWASVVLSNMLIHKIEKSLGIKRRFDH